MKCSNSVKSIGALAVAFAMAATLGLAGNPNPKVLPIGSMPYGHEYGVWSGLWWQWAYQFPLSASPVTDPNGDLAALGQSGPVWFLAGTYGGVAERTVTIPAGKALFFPIIDTIWVNLPELGDNPWSDEQRAFARTQIAPFIDNAYDLSCQIDGVEVMNVADYRCRTPDGKEYMVFLPADNVFAPYGLTEPGIYGPCVDDGIFLMLAPLTAGKHTIHFTAASPPAFTLDVTYDLMVLK